MRREGLDCAQESLMAIVSRLKSLISDRGMTQEEFAKIIGIAEPNLSKMCSGKAKASRFSTGDKLCKALSCEYGDIFAYVPDDEIADDDVVCYLASEEDSLDY